MKKFSDQEIITGLKKRDNLVIGFIYEQNFDAIVRLVVNNSGREDDAEDIFQEALIILFKKLRDGEELQLNNSSFSTYLYSVCRLLWLKKIRDSRKIDVKKLNREDEEFIEFEEPPPVEDKDLRYALYQKALKQIPEDCQKILTLSAQDVSQNDIAERLGFRSGNYVKKRKHFCKEYLVNKIKEDPEYMDMFDD